nr:intracellular protein transport protein USO1 isoform X3 [Crassostrea gigas]
MLGGYLLQRPLSAQAPCPVYRVEYNNDYERPRGNRGNGVGFTHLRQFCKYCADLEVEKSILEHEINRLENRFQEMLENKETEVSNRFSIIQEDLYRENSLLKERLSVEERRKFSEMKSLPYDQEVCIRQRYYRSLEDNAELERQLKYKENEVWALKRSLKETKSKLNCVVEDLKKREYDAMKMKLKISKDEEKHSRSVYDMTILVEEWSARCQDLTNENNRLKRELEEKNRSLFYRQEVSPTEIQSIKAENQILKDKIKEQETRIISLWKQNRRKYSDEMDIKKRMNDLEEENKRLLQENLEMTNKYKDAFRQKDNDLAALKRRLENKESELKSIQSGLQENVDMTNKYEDALCQKDNELAALKRRLENRESELKSTQSGLEEVEKANLLLSKNYGNNHHLNEELEALKRENSSLEKILQECLASFDATEQKLKRSDASVLFLEDENQQLKEQISNLKHKKFLQGNDSNLETKEIKRFKEEISNKEKEIKRLQEWIKTEERKSAQLQNDFSEDSKRKDSSLQRKDGELQKLLHENQRLQNEVTRLNSEISIQHKAESALNTIKLLENERELNTKRKEIESLHERIRQLENENMLLQKESDSVSKDRHNLHARNSNAADEVKLLQTETERKQIEVQRLQEKCLLHEKDIKELQKKHSKVSEERDNLFQRNQRLQDELNNLNAKIWHLEENRMETTDEWKHWVETKDTVKQLEKDNDRLNQNIDTLSKEKDIARSRYFEAEEKMRHLQLDIKSKGEEIQRLQKQVTQKEGDNEKLQESISNISKENLQLMESNKQLQKVNGKMLLATDESKRWQEKIKELQNEIRDLRHDLSKQKEGATKRISDLESVNANYNDQLLLATTESKRLQGRIKDLQSENSRLRRDIDDLSKQKEDALTRLSKVAGAKLTHGNAAITDLSDTDRPTKLAEKFSELYDNAWTDAFEELDNTFHNEEETIKVLLRIFQEAYKFCVETENNYETRIGQAVFTLASKTESHQIKNENVEIKKVLADLRISLSPACCSVIEEMVLSKLPSILKSIDVAACPLTKLYARQCASLSWKMRIRDPPLFVRFEFRCGSTFNADVLKRYTKTGGYLDFLVWPTLYLQENGPVLAKGVAQPKIAP